MNKLTIFRRKIKTHYFEYTPSKNEDQLEAFKHFSGGSISVRDSKIYNVSRVAKLHGYELVIITEEDVFETKPSKI